MSKCILLSVLFFVCLVFVWSPFAYSQDEGETPPPSRDVPESATVPNTQSTANLDIYKPGAGDPLSTPPVSDMSTADKEAKDAQTKEYVNGLTEEYIREVAEKEARETQANEEWVREHIKELKSSTSVWAEELVRIFETPHSSIFMGHSQVTDTISAPPAKAPASTKTEYLGGGFYGNVMPAGAAGKDEAKKASAAVNETAGEAGDIKKMQDTSKAGPPPSPPLPKDLNEFAEYMDSLSTSNDRDITKTPPATQQGGETQKREE